MYVLKYSYCRRSGKFNPPPYQSIEIFILFICNLNFSCIIPDNIHVVGCTVFVLCLYVPVLKLHVLLKKIMLTRI